MSKLKNYNGRYCESDYENAFLGFLEEEGWQYLPGNSIPRASRREVLYTDDLELFLSSTNPDLDPEEIRQIIGADSLAFLRVERLPELAEGLPCCDACFTGNYPVAPPAEDIRGEYDR